MYSDLNAGHKFHAWDFTSPLIPAGDDVVILLIGEIDLNDASNLCCV